MDKRSTHIIPLTGRYINYERSTGDYLIAYNGVELGYARSYRDAERRIDEQADRELRHPVVGISSFVR